MVRNASIKRSIKRLRFELRDKMKNDFGVGGGLHHRTTPYQLAA